MKRERVTIIVEVNLDPIPGACDNVQDFVTMIQRDLNSRVPHYNPTVRAAKEESADKT
jgi:hypothetical protein